MSTAVTIALCAMAMFFVAGADLLQFVFLLGAGGGTVALVMANTPYLLQRWIVFTKDPLSSRQKKAIKYCNPWWHSGPVCCSGAALALVCSSSDTFHWRTMMPFLQFSAKRWDSLGHGRSWLFFWRLRIVDFESRQEQRTPLVKCLPPA